jgi:hypothetical protein
MTRELGETRCERCGQLLRVTIPQGASEPVFYHAGQGADHPPQPVTRPARTTQRSQPEQPK